METRALLAIVLSIAVLAGFQYFFGNQMNSGMVAGNGTNASIVDKNTNLAGNEAKPAAKSPQPKPLKNLVKLPETSDVKGKDVVIDTPLFRAVLSENGAAFKHFVLKKYKQTIEKDSPGVDLVNVSPPLLPLGVKIMSGNEIDLRARYFKASSESIKLESGSEPATLTFECRLGDDATLTKKYTFYPGRYLIDYSMSIKGAGADRYTLFLYDKPYQESTRYIFSGPSYYAPSVGLEEISLKKPGDVHTYSGELDWLSYGDNYFMTALITLDKTGPWDVRITLLNEEKLTESSLSGRVTRVADGDKIHLCDMKLYIGPKEIERLKQVGHHLSKAINFGWFDPIAKPLLYVLNFLYKYVHNYGVCIIILTVVIKLLFWPLAHKSAQSMKTMQKLQPKLQKLKEKYGDDKERLNKELMQLYRTYKVNPMSGCLPMLLQIPVFFALYKVLLQAIELRHAPFVLWINDLSAPDRLMIPGVHIPVVGGIPVLTILMGASMYLQQKMSPSSLDPTQAKMMQFLPIIFTVMFINFPSGLVLYWLVNNILSIVQQYYVNKFTD
ncbi:MAG: membrane protein insertase YidC [Thermodesulfobacteria bacterium]|nr:membrane protein insertase YidC [Thermodesulfobacteriota bacterium]